MCGIAGFIDKVDSQEANRTLDEMIKHIRYRGPDDIGFWYESNEGIGLAHSRLSILDLTSTGHQPMHSISGRYVIVYNGEIYNHLHIRSKLESEGYTSWKGHSDTETLLAAIEHWGVEKSILKCTGMFAFAVWDKNKKALTLGRDRLGEKPLYYGWINGVFLFASELKALKIHRSFTADIDYQALELYLKFMSVPAPHSIYKNIYKVEPGCLVAVKLDQSVNHFKYWDNAKNIQLSATNKYQNTYQETKLQLERMLTRTVGDQMVADVTVGAFLSGGIDSSLIVALMQKHSSKKVKTYSISFDDERYDEASYAESVANYIGTDHKVQKVTAEHLLNIVPKLPYIYDEPFSDSSQIPTYLVSRFASEEVKVVLSGDGADELFGGYNRYVLTQKYWEKIRKSPQVMRNILASGFKIFSEQTWDMLIKRIARIIPSTDIEMFGNKIHKAASFINSMNDFELYQRLVFIEKEPESVLNTVHDCDFLQNHYDKISTLDNTIETIMALDQLVCLPSDILTKVDRAAMANSLETRIPFLDHEIVEYSWSMPLEYKISKGIGKKILRDILYQHIPAELFDRPKRGFGVPLDQWLRGELRSWAEDLLSKQKLEADGYFNAESIRTIWDEHLSGSRNHASRLWSILMFQSWLDCEIYKD